MIKLKIHENKYHKNWVFSSQLNVFETTRSADLKTNSIHHEAELKSLRENRFWSVDLNQKYHKYYKLS